MAQYLTMLLLLGFASQGKAQSTAGRAAAAEPAIPAPLTPAASMASMQLAAPLQIRLVAAEPLVQDPVAVCWDAHGAMYVAEMGDYPAQSQGGRVRRLVDRDGDGVMDHATVFADGLAYPTSVLPYREGVLVAAAPDIWWLRDLDGDGVADDRSILVTGFGQGNQQLRANSLTWGPDGWVYGANGRSDGELRMPQASQAAQQSLSIRNRDFRFQPDEQRVETTGGFTQFGLSFDDNGNRFISWNTIHIRHVVMEQDILSRNPRAPVTATVAEMSLEGSTPRVFPISRTTPRFNAEPPGYFNASCGLSIYRGHLLPDAYQGNAFACEPLSNLVHRDILESSGFTFVAKRPSEETQREFLAAGDPWFRPVNTATGPDGGLTIVDFYRPWVEHPQWVADAAARNSVDFSVGKDYGRIYRIVPKVTASSDAPIPTVDTVPTGTALLNTAAPPRSRPSPAPSQLAQLSDEQLMDLLRYPNAWQRETAQRLLVERGTVDQTALQRRALTAASGLERYHAFAVLHGLRQQDEQATQTLLAMLADASPAVRRLGLEWLDPQLARHELLENESTETEFWETTIFEEVSRLTRDPDARVRLSAVCGLANFKNAAAVATLASTFIEQGHDPWMRQAIFAAVYQRSCPLLSRVITARNDTRWLTQSQVDWLLDVVTAAAEDEADAWRDLLHRLESQPQHNAWRELIVLGLARHHGAAWLAQSAQQQPEFANWLDHCIARSERADNPWEQLLAIGLLEFRDSPDGVEILRRSMSPDQPVPHQLWAARAAAGFHTPAREAMLLGALKSSSPAVRRTIMDRFIAQQELASALAAALSRGEVSLQDLDSLQRQLLMERLTAEQRQGIEEETNATGESKQDLIGRYVQAYAADRDIQQGQQLFEQHCQSCHALGAVGHRIGPELTAVAGRSPGDIIADVLDPNRAVAADGYGYAILTHDNEVLSGLISGETDTSITIKRPGGDSVSVVRQDIQELRYLGKSLMPEGFERVLNPQQLANLVAFVKSRQ